MRIQGKKSVQIPALNYTGAEEIEKRVILDFLSTLKIEELKKIVKLSTIDPRNPDHYKIYEYRNIIRELDLHNEVEYNLEINL